MQGLPSFPPWDNSDNNSSLSLTSTPPRCYSSFLPSCYSLPAAQDASTGAIRGTVSDATGSRIPGATIVLVNAAKGFRYSVTTDAEGRFVVDLLPPGEYSGRAIAKNMSPQVTPRLQV